MENHHETEFFKNLIKKDVKQEWSKLRKEMQDTDKSVRNDSSILWCPREKIVE